MKGRIGVSDLLIPFKSPYAPAWVGLGVTSPPCWWHFADAGAVRGRDDTGLLPDSLSHPGGEGQKGSRNGLKRVVGAREAGL